MINPLQFDISRSTGEIIHSATGRVVSTVSFCKLNTKTIEAARDESIAALNNTLDQLIKDEKT